jgi:hypothetical protein
MKGCADVRHRKLGMGPERLDDGPHAVPIGTQQERGDIFHHNPCGFIESRFPICGGVALGTVWLAVSWPIPSLTWKIRRRTTNDVVQTACAGALWPPLLVESSLHPVGRRQREVDSPSLLVF